jgi:acid phosphatase (class A)
MKIAFLLLWVLGGSAALAGWKDISDKDLFLSPPPLAGSLEDKADLAKVLEAQAGPRDQDCAFANSHLPVTFESLYTGFLSEAEIQRTRPLLDEVLALVRKISDPLKLRYPRPRPFTVDPHVHPCISESQVDDLSYPSGHAAFGIFSACVLEQLFPERADALRAYGEYLGEFRVRIGVHYPTDVAAGRSLGAQLCELACQDPALLEAINAVR